MKKLTSKPSGNLVSTSDTSDGRVDSNITKTRLFKYLENFFSKNWKFSDKKLRYFSEAFLTSTYNLCFEQK